MAYLKTKMIEHDENDESKDEVDFVQTSKSDVCLSCSKNQQNSPKSCNNLNNNCTKRAPGLLGDLEGKPHNDKFHFFNFPRRQKSDPCVLTPQTSKSVDAAKQSKRSKFIKSASIARIFGNTYNTKKYDDSSALLKLQQLKRSFLSSEKFHKKENSHDDDTKISDASYVNDSDVSVKAIKSFTRGIGKLLRRNCSSVDISTPDPEYKVSYLGNVLTGWAKGEGCVEKPLATLWRNYTQNSKPEVMMKLCLCPSGLKATTRQHGLTEYWSHRITHCSSPKNYPRVFCWIYRHEGRKLKHEFRCHAVICSKESVAKEISTILKENLAKALHEFKRDKISRQNARLSLANSVYENPSMPRRKIMLSVGANNYRPPLERSKSAPKLMAIEEMIGEEDEEDAEENSHKPKAVEEGRACCKEDALYPSTTLGRRRCRRGHSIRRSRLRNSFKSPKDVEAKLSIKNENVVDENPMNQSVDSNLNMIHKENDPVTKTTNNSDSSEDDFESFLLNYNYNSKEPLSSELISYFDMQMNHPKTTSLQDLSQNPSSVLDDARLEDARLALSLDDLNDYDHDHHDHDDDDDDEVFFNQADVMEILRNAAESASNYSGNNRLSGNEKTELVCLLQRNGDDITAPPSLLCVATKMNGNSDSDEGSISSGCETSSTVTSNTDDSASTLLIKPCSVLDRVRSFEQLAELNHVINEPIGEKGALSNQGTMFKRSITFPTPGVKSSFMLPSTLQNDADSSCSSSENGQPTASAVNQELINHLHNLDSDSELSDESGYVEYQDHHQNSTKRVLV